MYLDFRYTPIVPIYHNSRMTCKYFMIEFLIGMQYTNSLLSRDIFNLYLICI